LRIGIIYSQKASELERAIKHVQDEFVETLAETAREMGITVTTEVVEERPVAEAVVARAKKSSPDFILKGTHFHSNAERGIMIDSDWQLARISPYPIWFVKGSQFEESPMIVAAVDPTHSHDKPAILDDTIVRMTKLVADATDGTAHLFHTYERLAGIGDEAIKVFKPVKIEIDKIDKKIQAEHREALDALAERNKVDEKNVHQLPGKTRDLLPSFVRSNNVQLVVMGVLARWGIKKMVVGSTAERVMDHLPCDILIVRAAE
jgi:universal stress protein E